ncbi:MAG: hypothetical protein ABSB30_09680 [Terracidiphilus sp.]
MQVTFDIPDELVARIRARGLEPQSFAQGVVDDAVARGGVNAEDSKRHEAVDAMVNFSAKHGATPDGINLKSMVHEGHKY